MPLEENPTDKSDDELPNLKVYEFLERTAVLPLLILLCLAPPMNQYVALSHLL